MNIEDEIKDWLSEVDSSAIDFRDGFSLGYREGRRKSNQYEKLIDLLAKCKEEKLFFAGDFGRTTELYQLLTEVK